MSTEDDLSMSLPKPPPPHPVRREAAIEAALRRFDGTAEDTAAADRPRATSPPFWTRLRQPQTAVLVSAAIVAAIGLPAALITIRDMSPSPSRETATPRTTQSGQAPSPPQTTMPNKTSGGLEVRAPAQSTASSAQPPPTANLVSANSDVAAAETASPPATYAPTPAAPAPPPAPQAAPPAPQAAPMVEERNANETVASDLAVTGTRIAQPSVSSNASKASKRARSSTSEQAAVGGTADSAYSAFLLRLQSAIRANDHRSVIRLIGFPLRVNSSSGTRLYRDARSVERDFDRIFTPQVKEAILQQESDRLFTRDQGAMIGDGEVWFDHTCPNSTCTPLGPVRIKAVNR